MINEKTDKKSQIENIPDTDGLSRAFFEIPATVAPEMQFPFRYDKVAKERAESVFWRKYAPLISEIHARGCALQTIKNARYAESGKRSNYIGARSTDAGTIRRVKSQRGHALAVIHFPENGDISHSHISIQPSPGMSVEKIKSNDILELAHILLRQFGPLDSHICPG